MNDPVLAHEDFSAEKSNSEKRNSKHRVSLPRNSILASNGNGSSNFTAVRARRQSSRTSFPRLGIDRRWIRYENTYRMEPQDDYRLDMARLSRVANSAIETSISGYQYDGNHGKQFCSVLADNVRSQIKQLPFHRYKIVVQVVIGQKKGQDLRVASRCMWDTKWDRHTTITKQTKDAYVSVTMFLVYTE